MASTTAMLCFLLVCIITSAAANEIIITFNITEEEESNRAFGNIAEKVAPFLNTNETNLRYYFAPTDLSEYQSLFNINDISGDIFTAVVIDREDVCKYDSSCILEFNVLVSSAELTYYKIVAVKIIINDKNDNAPMFPSDHITLNISEGTHIGSMFRISPAQDLDTGGNNSVQTYEILQNTDANGTFSLSVSKTDLGTFRVSLVVDKILDREVKDTYTVKVIAKDGGTPSRSGTLTLRVQVQDTNDNQPEFSQNLYNVTVKETVPIDETILVLSASDKDIGENGRITYRIKVFQRNKDLLDKLFRLNEYTGELKIRSELSSHAGESIQFIIEALDHGDESFVTEVEVLVHIEDSGNNAPVVSVGFLAPGNKRFVNVSENSSIGTLVAHVNVQDTDKGSNGNVSCQVSDKHFGMEDLEGKGFIVVVKSLLDREVKNTFNLTITCSDQGTPVMSGKTSFLVHVTDKNDNKPVFDSSSYSAKILENNKGNEMILKVSASDADLDRNAHVVYAVHEDAAGKFVIDRITGVISVNAVFDRENASLITFHVLAIDNGEIPLTGTATVSLTVEDKNDNAPEFVKAVHGFSILENQQAGTSVGTLMAKDIDAGLNAEVSFAIAPEYVDSIPFILFSNGELKTNQQLDREERSRYDFVAIVKDLGESPLSSSTHVTVVVTDDNDNAPIFTFPDPSNNSISVLYPDYENKFVARLEAYDLDEGRNKEIQFSLKSGDELDILDIDSESGVLSFTKQIDIGADKLVELEVSAADNGDIPKVTVKKLFIELRYTNSTFLKSSAEEENSLHIIISVIVVIVTILISGIILGIIFFLRNKDKKKQSKVEEPRHHDTDFGFHGLTQSHTIFSPDTLSSGSLEGRDPIKKKEVSFILDTSDSTTDCQHEMQNTSLGSSYSRSKPFKPSLNYSSHSDSGLDVHDLQKEANAQLQSVKLQQMIMQSRAKQWVQSQQQQYGLPQHDDHHSEGSSETIGSDSGRGCSEEDDMFSTPSADDPKLFDVSSPESQRCFIPPQRPVCPKREIPRTSSYIKKPWTRKPHLATKDPSQTCLGLNRNLLYQNAKIVHSDDIRNDLSNVGQNRMSWGSAYHGIISPMDYTGDSALHSFFNKTPVCVLRDEDDNCSTTTSGSYTIQSEEIL